MYNNQEGNTRGQNYYTMDYVSSMISLVIKAAGMKLNV